MELLNSFLGQGMIAQIGEIVLFANTVTMAMPTRWITAWSDEGNNPAFHHRS